MPEELHRSVREVIEKLVFLCPGCGIKMQYESMFDHVTVSDKIDG